MNVLVLLAQDNNRYLHDYILPPKVIQDHWKKFARNDGRVEIVLKKGRTALRWRPAKASYPSNNTKAITARCNS